MAVNGNGATETAVSGRVASVNEKGIRLDGADSWLNFSKYAVGLVAPEKGEAVTVTLDRAGFIRCIVREGGASGASAARPSSSAPPAERDRTITRLAVLKAAAEFGASRPELRSRDVLAIAASWEWWVLREGSVLDEAARPAPELQDRPE